MITLNFSGSSHGKGYEGRISGLPNGFTFDVEPINEQLRNRKCGYGRSGRQANSDVAIFDGFTDSVTVDGDVNFFVANASCEQRAEITAVRSGHVDWVGIARYPDKTSRDLAERASGRSSLCYVVLGAICRQYLSQYGIDVYHYVEKIGGISARRGYRFGESEKEEHFGALHCPCKYATERMIVKINDARSKGNSLGGVVAVGARGVPMGLGEILPYEARLDAVISSYFMGIPSVKGVEFGLGAKYADIDGIKAHDELTVQNGKIVYSTNKCGGVVSGITNGRDILCKLTVKPIPTVKGVQTVDSASLSATEQLYERADVCVVPQIGVIAENILAYVLMNQMLKQGY